MLSGSIGITRYAFAKYAIPNSSTISIPIITVRVRCARFTLGSPNAITPFDTASTPVIAAHPLANAFNSIHVPSTPTLAGSGGGTGATGIGCPPVTTVFHMPTAINVNSVPTNKNVGKINAVPVSFTPRKFTTTRSARMVRHISKVWRCRCGTADVNAVTPAEIPTAAVRM